MKHDNNQSVDTSPAATQAPPENLARRVGGTTGEKFLSQGADFKKCIAHSLPPDFTFEGKRVLDFGCGSGRVLRHFQAEARSCEFFGCDIDGPSIDYLQEQFPEYRVFRNEEHPPLPVEDAFFDLIYCVSVFTHLPHTWSEWLQEMHRVLKPGGILIATFLSKAAYENTMKAPFDRERSGFIPAFLDRPWERGGPNVYMSNQWVTQNWGKVFSLEAIIDDGMMNWQSIALMRKMPDISAPTRSQPRVLRPFIYQDYCDKSIIGNIEFDKFPSSSWHESCGIMAAGRECTVRGWFAAKESRVTDISARVGGKPVKMSWEPVKREAVQRAHPDYFNSLHAGFIAKMDISAISAGTHELVVAARDEAGKCKEISATLNVR